jgi:hypothetical protein
MLLKKSNEGFINLQIAVLLLHLHALCGSFWMTDDSSILSKRIQSVKDFYSNMLKIEKEQLADVIQVHLYVVLQYIDII